MSISLFADSYTNKPAEKMLDIRFVGSLSGCYSLASRDDASEDVVQVFACRVQSISTKSAVLSAPVAGEVGERVSAKFEQFPALAGTISRVFKGGFAMDFLVNEKTQAEIAAKIDWIKKNRFRAIRDKRQHKRVMPPNPQSAITLSDGTVMECFVIDVSKSGVAVSADCMPAIGSRLAIGRAVGIVVRHIEGGFAAKMDELLELDDLDPIFQWSLTYVNTDGNAKAKAEADVAHAGMAREA